MGDTVTDCEMFNSPDEDKWKTEIKTKGGAVQDYTINYQNLVILIPNVFVFIYFVFVFVFVFFFDRCYIRIFVSGAPDNVLLPGNCVQRVWNFNAVCLRRNGT